MSSTLFALSRVQGVPGNRLSFLRKRLLAILRKQQSQASAADGPHDRRFVGNGHSIICLCEVNVVHIDAMQSYNYGMDYNSTDPQVSRDGGDTLHFTQRAQHGALRLDAQPTASVMAACE
jgi:hypothetical protein